MVSIIVKYVEKLGQADVFMSFFPDLVMRVKLPLINDYTLDSQVAQFDTISLSLRHLQHSCLSNDHIRLNLELLQVIQMLLQFEMLLSFADHKLEQIQDSVRPNL